MEYTQKIQIFWNSGEWASSQSGTSSYFTFNYIAPTEITKYLQKHQNILNVEKIWRLQSRSKKFEKFAFMNHVLGGLAKNFWLKIEATDIWKTFEFMKHDLRD
jgi:hypothetical protein